MTIDSAVSQKFHVTDAKKKLKFELNRERERSEKKKLSDRVVQESKDKFVNIS